MIFYRLEGTATSICGKECPERQSSKEASAEYSNSVLLNTDSFNFSDRARGQIFVSNISGKTVSIGIITMSKIDVVDYYSKYLEHLKIELTDINLEEITMYHLTSMLSSAARWDYITDTEEIRQRLDINDLSVINHTEGLIADKEKGEIYKFAGETLYNNDMMQELDRIYSKKDKKIHVLGNPVHYIVQKDSPDDDNATCDALLEALWANNRLGNRRFSIIDLSSNRSVDSRYDVLYKNSIGGVILIKFFSNVDNDENGYASFDRSILDPICELIKKYRNKVLTVFSIRSGDTKKLDIIKEFADCISFVRLGDGSVTKKRAEEFFTSKANKLGIETDTELFEKLSEKEGYYSAELHRIFEEWYDEKLKNDIYPQYSNVENNRKAVAAQKPKGSGYDELMEMTGIDEAKQVIKMALDYHKAIRMFADKNISSQRFTKHMVFTGNPGTAKTTVARLFARIMKENNLLGTGEFVEVGRADLVGKFVGWTARLIKKKFSEAKGGVLFIDEAYSLVDEHNGSFGDEAINTIVQEMENNRDNVIVIFAGYPDKMKEFIDRNPGLSSRIAFHVSFPDYSTPELCEIASLTAGKMDLNLSCDAKEKLEGIFDAARLTDNYGNGRYVRNIIEKARMKQMSRLVEIGYEAATQYDLTTIIADDIDIPTMEKTTSVSLGFC